MSTKLNFTPGPWYSQGNAVVSKETHWSVAVVTVRKPDMSDGAEARDTTKLIATAPEMYAILDEILMSDGMMPDTLGKINQLFNKINQ